jgi:hypothetical protein
LSSSIHKTQAILAFPKIAKTDGEGIRRLPHAEGFLAE